MTEYRVIWGDPAKSAIEERFWSKVQVRSDDECWEWQGGRHELGYGRFNLNGKTTPAHRISYMWLVGPIPDGMHLDHLCRNPPCVNPSHLEPVTPRENIMRGVIGEMRRTGKCVRGHEVQPHERQCRVCDLMRAHRRRVRLGIVQGKGVRILDRFDGTAVGGTHDVEAARNFLRDAGIDAAARRPRLTWFRTLRNGDIEELAPGQQHRGRYRGVIFE